MNRRGFFSFIAGAAALLSFWKRPVETCPYCGGSGFVHSVTQTFYWGGGGGGPPLKPVHEDVPCDLCNGPDQRYRIFRVPEPGGFRLGDTVVEGFVYPDTGEFPNYRIIAINGHDVTVEKL